MQFHYNSPDGLVEPAAVENGTYVKYDVVDVAGSGHVSCCLIMIHINFFNSVFSIVLLMSHECMEDINATLLYKHACNQSSLILSLSCKNINNHGITYNASMIS